MIFFFGRPREFYAILGSLGDLDIGGSFWDVIWTCIYLGCQVRELGTSLDTMAKNSRERDRED